MVVISIAYMHISIRYFSSLFSSYRHCPFICLGSKLRCSHSITLPLSEFHQTCKASALVTWKETLNLSNQMWKLSTLANIRNSDVAQVAQIWEEMTGPNWGTAFWLTCTLLVF